MKKNENGKRVRKGWFPATVVSLLVLIILEVGYFGYIEIGVSTKVDTIFDLQEQKFSEYWFDMNAVEDIVRGEVDKKVSEKLEEVYEILDSKADNEDLKTILKSIIGLTRLTEEVRDSLFYKNDRKAK